MNFLVQGNSESGKSTAAEMLAKMIGSPPPRNCSDFIIRDFATTNGLDPQEVLAHKDEYRQQLFMFGKSKQDVDPAYPVSEAFKHTKVVTGIRRKENLDGAKHLIDKIIWIDRKTAKPNQTDQLGPEYADIIIDNNGSLKDLEINLIAAVQGK